jgi:phospholipid/cholesterol/gamma-HCH transport system substrate-binding protein
MTSTPQAPTRRGNSLTAKIGLAALLVAVMVAGVVLVVRSASGISRTNVVAYFDNSNGIFVGDEVRLLGVPVGKIVKIEPEPQQVKITFWYENQNQVPADAKAVILSPSLVTARAIQLTPAYTGGPVMQDDSVIPLTRTAVPVEWDDFRTQLQRLTETLQPTQPGGVSTLGQLVNTAADNLRGQGGTIRDTVIKLSQAFSALGDHSTDIFSTLKNLSILVSALQDSADLMRQLNGNLASVSAQLSDDPNEVGTAVKDLSDIADDVRTFVADNRETLGTTSDKLASVSQALTDSLDDIKQLLHVAPTTLQNFINIYQPAQGTLSGALSANNLSDPITFICGAIQAASRLNAEQSAKLCVQYLAPIVKNRQLNFPPLGENLFVGPSARPNEVTYSEDWMRPDYVPPQPNPAVASAPTADQSSPPVSAPLAAEAQQTDPTAGLPGLMLPPGGGS